MTDLEPFETKPLTAQPSGGGTDDCPRCRHDAARACRLAITSDWGPGHEVFFINGAESTLNIPSVEACARCYPGVPIDAEYFEVNPRRSVLSVEKVMTSSHYRITII